MDVDRTNRLPTIRYVEAVPVIVESLALPEPEVPLFTTAAALEVDALVDRAFVVAFEYLMRVDRLGLDRSFVRAFWFSKTPYEPGIIFRAGRFVAPRAMAPYAYRTIEAEHTVVPWHFAREF